MADKPTLVATELRGYEPQVGAALWRLEDTRHRTLGLLSDVPAEYVDRETRGNTIGTILYHVALIEADWLYSEILEEPYADQVKALLPADDRDHEGILTAVRGQPLAEHIARLRFIRAIYLDKLREVDADDFNRARSFPDYDVSPAWVVHHLTQHEAEHRGELGSVIDTFKAG
jgi:uncharacterized damage-inducible protein DinB